MTWSSTQPLSGAWSPGWWRQNRKRPPGPSTRATSATGATGSTRCSKTRQATTASKAPSANGRGSGAPRREGGPPPPPAPPPGRAPGGGGPTTAPPRPAPQPGHLPLPRPDVEHPANAGQVLTGEGEDLLLVLGVGPAGEALLPPPGVGLPRIR